MEDEDRAAVLSPAVSEFGAVARIPGALFSPGKTFESIARKPTWLLPLLLWTVLSVGVTAVVVPKMDFERMFRERMEKSGQNIPEERMQEIIGRQKRIGGVFGYVFAVATPAVLSLLVCLILWGSFKAFGWDTSFGQAFGATTHAFLPGILASILLIPVIWSRESVDPRSMGDLLRSNPGFLVDRDSAKVVHSLLQSLDILSIWSLYLFTVGFAAAARVGQKKAAAVIVTLWLLYVLGKAGFRAVFG